MKLCVKSFVGGAIFLCITGIPLAAYDLSIDASEVLQDTAHVQEQPIRFSKLQAIAQEVRTWKGGAESPTEPQVVSGNRRGARYAWQQRRAPVELSQDSQEVAPPRKVERMDQIFFRYVMKRFVKNFAQGE